MPISYTWFRFDNLITDLVVPEPIKPMPCSLFIATLACDFLSVIKYNKLEMWANAQRDGHPAEYRWRPLFNAAKFG